MKPVWVYAGQQQLHSWSGRDRRWGGAGWDPSLGGGWGAVSFPAGAKLKIHSLGKAKLLALWDVRKPVPGEPKPSGASGVKWVWDP